MTNKSNNDDDTKIKLSNASTEKPKKPVEIPERYKDLITDEEELELVQELELRIRDSYAQVGPMFIPQPFKDMVPDHEFYLELYDADNTLPFYSTLRLGWEYVRPAEMPGLQERLIDSTSKNFTVDQGEDKIICGRKGNKYHVLLKMPKRRHELMRKLRQKRRQEMRQAKVDGINKDSPYLVTSKLTVTRD